MLDNQIKFSNDRSNPLYTRPESSKQRSWMIAFVMKCGVATEEQARSVLFGFIIVTFLVALYLFFFSGKHTTSYADIPASEKDDFFHVYQR